MYKFFEENWTLIFLMNADQKREIMGYKHSDLTKDIIGAFYEVGLLLNFGPMPKNIRKAFDNHNKPHLFNEITQ